MDSTSICHGRELDNDEVISVLHAAILAGDGRSRLLDLHLATLSAERLTHALRDAGIRLVRADG